MTRKELEQRRANSQVSAQKTLRKELFEHSGGFLLLFAAALVGILFLVGLSGCGSTGPSDQVAQGDASPSPTPVATPEINPFTFEEVGDALEGMPIHIENLPSGNWLVAERAGAIYLLDANFKLIAQASIPVAVANDSAMTTAIQDPDFANNHRIYVFYTLPIGSAAPCDINLCNTVVRYDLDEASAGLISNPETVALYPTPNDIGEHNGGGMTFGPDGALYVGVGDGQFWANLELTFEHDLAQNPNSTLGKIFRIDTQTLASQQVAMGVRNPFTMISTPLGAVFGDVGYENTEEADLLRWNSVGVNYGWPWTEGVFQQNIWPNFTEPYQSFHHCDEKYKDDDAFAHENVGKGLVIKNHNGVVHPCGNEIITVSGYYAPRQDGDPDPYQGALDDSVFYSEPYYGWIRHFDIKDPTIDAQLAHFPGLSSITEGPDGYLYGTSIFGSQHIVRLVKNPEAQ